MSNPLTSRGENPQIKVHIYSTLNVGIAPERIIETFFSAFPIRYFPKY